ncbi:VanZ family protein [Microbacterium telephonicum]|uniref:VanZ like protein n=1 Tax=Microbacterium telephonicum TaxID=1714841 RepID=A0A498C2V7_9MICO|nr:VanZ family protein [Microbacterium telephonicum]RLK48976.1 VanZ like protein [Microbacterium telephonicum]
MVGRPHRDRGRGHALTSPSAPARGRVGRIALVAATVVYALVLASQTLGPQPETAGGVLSALTDWFAQWPASAWLTYPVLEFTANVVLFLPVGILWVLWRGGRGWAWAAAIGLAVSTAIETTQGLLLPDRFADVRDLVSNTLGALLGAAVLAVLLRRARRRAG